MKNKIITVAVVAVLAGVGVFAAMAKDDDMASMDMNSNNSQSTDMSTAEPNTVIYKGFAVQQKTLTVKKGTTVTWKNQDQAKHDVTPTTETAEFKASELFGEGESYSHTFNTVGTFSYICSPHPYMKGTIEVTE